MNISSIYLFYRVILHRKGPSIMWIIENKFSEFQEIIKGIKLEAKHIYFKYVRSTTSKIVYKKKFFTMSAKGLTLYLFFACNNFVFNKTNVLFF